MNRKGFLLFEVMVSIVIITAGFFFIVNSFSSSKRAMQRSTGLVEISLVIEEKLWELEDAGAIEIGHQEGDFVGSDDYAWRIEAQPVAEEEFGLVTIEVVKKEEPDQPVYALETYLSIKEE